MKLSGRRWRHSFGFPRDRPGREAQIVPLLARLVRARDDSWDARSVKHEWDVLAEKDQTTGGFA
jgi:hypothetical protein